MHFQYDCVRPKKLSELEFIIDNSKDITRQTFIKNVGAENYKELEESLGYSKEFKLKNDCYVGYYKSKTPKGDKAYYCKHSAIEYIFY